MKRRLNWPLWTGFLLSVIAFFSFFAFFVNFPITRDFPWANLLLFGLAAVLLFVGLRRTYREPTLYRGKIFGPILAVLSVAVFALFSYGVFVASRQLPVARGAPQVGQKAPEFSLLDTTGKPVLLSQLLSAPLPGAAQAPKGVLLVFYRGYWWPACNSELRGIEKNLDALAKLGIRPVAISVDAPEVSRDLATKAGYTYPLLSDPQAEVIKRYDLLHPGAGVNGQAVARPAEFLVDSSGTVRWVNMTENYWVRATPEQIIEAAKTL